MTGSQLQYGAVPGLSGTANQIAPMRRGRPTKATASEDMQLLPERQVRTGMAALGGGSGEFGASFSGNGAAKGGGTTGSWDAFGSFGAQDGGEGAAPAAAVEAGTTASANGFADAFAPNSPVHATSPRFPDAGKPSAELETSVQLPSNIAMFAELSKSPNSEAKPTNASSTAVNNGDDDDEERKRFESTFPDINSDFALLAPASAPSQRAVPPLTRAKSAADLPESLVDVNEPIAKPPVVDEKSNKMPAQLTGERDDVDEAGPPLPRRPPSAASSVKSPAAASDRPLPNPKPTLVSRGSQTSPRLMADWKPLPSSGLGAPGSGPSPKSTDPVSSSATSTETSSLRQSSLPNSELLPALQAPALQAESQGGAVVEDRKGVVDLLGDDLDDGDTTVRGALGQGADSFLPMQAKPATGASDHIPSAGSVANKRMSFLAGTQPQSTSSPAASSGRSLPGSPSFGGGGGGEREKFRPLKRTSLGQPGAPPPVTSPKPAIPTSSLPSSAGQSEAPDAASVEARFPDLSLDHAVSEERAYKSPQSKEQWDEVVEKDDEADSSSSEDDEDDQRSARPSATKIAAPSFDEDDAPTLRQSSSSTRPRFGETTAAAPPPPRSASQNSTAAPGTENRQQSFASMSSEGGGGIDLGPALASIHRFAPQSNQSAPGNGAMRASPGPLSPSSLPSQPSPPLPSAKSRSGSINSLVSRYEGRGLTGGPPPLGKKPVGLRKNSDNASLDGEGTSPLLRRDPVQPQKLPQWSLDSGGRHSPAPSLPSIKSPSFDEREETPNVSAPSADEARRVTSPAPNLPAKPATPTIADRQPFKPIPPPGSPGGARNLGGYNHATRPSFGGGRGPPAAGAPASSSTVAPPTAASDEADERFAGVSNMKSRWESMAKARDADIQAARTRPRREHAAI